MRWFWGLLALAAIAAAVLLMVRRPTAGPAPAPAPPRNAELVRPEGRTEPPAAAPTTPPRPPADADRTPPQASPANSAESSPVAADVERTATGPVSSTGAADQVPAVRPVEPRSESAATSPSGPAAPPPTTPRRDDSATSAEPSAKPADSRRPSPADAEALALKQSLDEMLGLVERNPVRAAAEVMSPPVPAGAAPGSAPAAPAPAASATAAAKLAPRGDGTTLVDDRFILKGSGTREDPYVTTWEMLVSAQESYQPRLGRKIIPDRLKMLDGKWIRIAGFIAFPLMAQSQDEMLMMLNQWDGCCIGVPPTPYDAIEVKLKAAAKGDDRLRVSGSVTGILRVDPYLVKDWLVSLYLMDDAELRVDTGGAKRDPTTLVPGHKPPE